MEGQIVVEIDWKGGEEFAGGVGNHEIALDGESRAGLSPMQLLASGVAGCMGIDIAHILGKMRTPAQGLSVRLETERAEDPPRRFTRLLLRIHVQGDVPRGNVDRAVALSRNKYCSALSSIRLDTDVQVEVEVSPPPAA